MILENSISFYEYASHTCPHQDIRISFLFIGYSKTTNSLRKSIYIYIYNTRK